MQPWAVFSSEFYLLTAKGAKIAKMSAGYADNVRFWVTTEINEQARFETGVSDY
jgi:hypothetical protein